MEWKLVDLEPFTEYSIVLQAYNRKGTGPLSEPVSNKTQPEGKKGSYSNHDEKGYKISIVCIIFVTIEYRERKTQTQRNRQHGEKGR